jgi:E3 ubiquitin-protein ligase UHRF1
MCRYEDDRDEGDWFLYTGSGGRDLSGNKRTAKVLLFSTLSHKLNVDVKKAVPEARVSFSLSLCLSSSMHRTSYVGRAVPLHVHLSTANKSVNI